MKKSINEMLKEYLASRQLTAATMNVKDADAFISQGDYERNELITFFKAMKETNRAVYLYGLTLLGSDGVLPSIYTKAQGLSHRVLPAFEFPRADVPLSQRYKYANQMVKFLDETLGEKSKEVLAGNHHEIPAEAFTEEKRFYEASENLKVYLEEKHQRKVIELQDFCDRQAIWYEQVITQEVVDYVNERQEVLGGVYQDHAIYVTKIPYDTVAYLKASAPIEKRYHYCHCAFAKDAILHQKALDPKWCHCSGGFAKHPFEVILERPLEVEVVQSVLNGDSCCRFKIIL